MNEKKVDPKTVKITLCYSDSVRTATKLRLIRIIKRLSRLYFFWIIEPKILFLMPSI